jgi:Lrp/AsnC family transcriptional regulator, leucine-responsive regulatory protein
MYAMDLKDKKLLTLLDENSRYSNTQLAKKLGISKPAVEYRIQRLEKNKVIFSFYTEMDFSKLGYSHYKLYFKFQDTDQQDEQLMLDYWMNDKNTTWLAQTRGAWDMAVSIQSRNNYEFSIIVDQFMKQFATKILTKAVLLTQYSPVYSREYLDKTEKTEFVFGLPKEFYELDEKDTEILKTINVNARISIVEICNKTKLSRDIVMYRMKKLQKDKIITQFRCYPNLENIGIHHYKLLLRTKNLDLQWEKKIRQYVMEHEKATQFLKLIGSWDIEIEVETADEDELYMFIQEIRKEFSSILRDYDILRIIKTRKYNYFPF